MSAPAAVGTLVFATLIAGELPDLDIAGSRISRGRTLRRVPLVARIVLAALALPALALGVVLRGILRLAGGWLAAHRGLLHSAPALVGFALLVPPLYLLYVHEAVELGATLLPAAAPWCSSVTSQVASHSSTILGVGGLVTGAGVASHLTLDAMTPHGVPLLAPISDRAFRLPWTIRTGSRGELPVALVLLAAWLLAAQHAVS
jgi:membrane-bound metal-dependent hydrolase YbcI (DUF457 family)